MQPPQTDKIGYANVVGHICGHGENTLGGKLSINSVFGPLYKLVIFVILCDTSYIVDPFLTFGYFEFGDIPSYISTSVKFIF